MKKIKNERIQIALIVIVTIFFTTMLSNTEFGGLAAIINFAVTIYCIVKISMPKVAQTQNTFAPEQAQSTPSSFVDNFVKCPKCNVSVKAGAKFCGSCGAPIPETHYATINDYNEIFRYNEVYLLKEFITKELNKAGVDLNTQMVPLEVLKRKKVFSLIFSFLLFTYISMIFFHFPMLTYIIGLIILVIFNKKTKNYDLMEYLTKEIKSRPSEKISNIVMNTKENLVADNQKTLRIASTVAAIFIPMLIFMNPHIMYEKTTDGYSVRFYTFGLTNMTTATIPSTHNGENVVSLRGNTFSNMHFLTDVTLPDTIKEIRGQAFKNDASLESVNIPRNLEYLGGGAFYNCSSLKSIELPDTLTFLGGESFKGASSLERIRLSNNLSEIRGNTFEECTSLKSIIIPDNVTRIGGHAFYGDGSLSEVSISENSKLSEIGSSAFRQCSSLYTITIPRNTYVNDRAFKESPTQIHYYGYNEEFNDYY